MSYFNKKQNPDLSSFVNKLAGYYCQFLETDFKKGREPKRKFAYRDRADRKIGIRASKYPGFLTLLHKKVNQAKPQEFKIEPGKFESTLSVVAKESISAAIDTVDMSPLESSFSELHDKVAQALSVENMDIEKILEGLSETTKKIIDGYIVSPVLNVVAPVFERQSKASIALDQLISYSEEISTILTANAEESFPTALGDLGFRNDGNALTEIFNELQDEEYYKKTLKKYFSNFVAADLFTEFREIITTHRLAENTQFYVNIGEVKDSKGIFPIYCLPINITIDESKVFLSFEEPILYANKRAIDYMVGQISQEQGIRATNPITDRIFYKSDDETFVGLANKTFHAILIGLQAEGKVLLTEKQKNSAKGATGISITNELTISLADKSDESIVNDYEALMTGLDGGDQLLSVFSNIINNFLTTNPVSIEPEIDDEWRDTDVTERLVFLNPLPLAEEQRKILSAIKNKDSKFISVEGPPGTGKSHTIAAIAFEMILKGENILILSDKKEALNVVENKINEVLEKVRGKETAFVNPILRLGKTGSNYENIIKTSSINRLRIAKNTFDNSKEAFNAEFDDTNSQLRTDIQNTALAGKNIEIEKIISFYTKETKFIEDNPGIKDLLEQKDNYLKILHSMQKLVQDNRESFASLFSSEDLNKLSRFLEVAPIIEEIPDNIFELLRIYPKIKLDKTTHINQIIKNIQDAKGLFGYFFAKSKLDRFSQGLKEIISVHIPSPQNKLDELGKLSTLAEDLNSILTKYGSNEFDLELFKEFLISGLKLDKSERETVVKYIELDKDPLDRLNIPHLIIDFLPVENDLTRLLNNYYDLHSDEENLINGFENIPDFDYLKNKTFFESLNSQILANSVDERVVEFVTNNRTDARVLAKIIKSKGKFPTDKFDILKEAFPCIIAGLRDFAEYIPLEADLFDLVIIDEASQVSIAQALPAILRAKKMVVMGDRKQYSNVKTSTASKELNRGYFNIVRQEFEQAIAVGNIDLMTRFGSFDITNSVLDFFDMVSNFTIQLRKHFRGYPEMISFSSEYFYDEYLQVLKIRGKPIEQVLEFIEVDDFERLETTKNANEQEAEIIIDELNKLIDSEENPPSVGIITPFSAQQKFLSNKINDHPNAVRFQKKLKLAIFTFDSCQGEERDIIMYSMVANHQEDKLNHIFPLDVRGVSEDEIDGKIRFQRLNVGFSRGKEKLVFILSKPLKDFKGSIGQTLKHYKEIFDKAKDAPTEDDVDENSPMEKKLLNWIKQTGFYTRFINSMEIIPQFPIGQYLKSIDPGYQHPKYKVDFLIRLTIKSEVYQFIIEYDGFENHFINKDEVNALNWQSYLTPGDVERECILESYGYKMIRVNRFNLGSDPVSNLDKRLRDLIKEYVNLNENRNYTMNQLQQETTQNIRGLDNKTHRECKNCKQIKQNQDFFDATLKTGYGYICKSCKGPKYKSHKARKKSHKARKNKTKKQCTRCNQIKPIEAFFDAELASQYGLICNTCKGPNYKSHKARKDKTKKRCRKCNQIKPIEEFFDAELKSKFGVMCQTCKGPGYSARRARSKAFFANRRG